MRGRRRDRAEPALRPASSSSRAWRLAASSPLGAEHADDLGDQLVAVDPLDASPRAWPAVDALLDPEVGAASEATCGRWVMQSTCRPSPSARSRSPTARAVLPPTPASTSSKTQRRARRRRAPSP